MAPNTVLNRHTGPENRTGRFIRIHIPLIVPEGDVFLEVNGEEVKWDDLFGFNNQFVHSAYNNTDQYRLVFLLDLDREFIGMSPGEPWDERFEELAIQPFVRKKDTQ
jgi:aspartyl/asparaginyl beta-hydroxylase (cupin superfamily)